MRWFPAIFGPRGDPIDAIYFLAILICLAIIGQRWLQQRWRWWSSGALDRGKSRCARCDYILMPGGSTICCECGADVRYHGIVNTALPPRTARGPFYVLAALIVLPAAVWLSGFTVRAMPVGWHFYTHHFVTLSDGKIDIRFGRYTVQGEGEGRYFGRNLKVLWVYRNDGFDQALNMLWVNPQTLQTSWRSRTGFVEMPQPLTPEIVQRFVATTAAGVQDSTQVHAAAEILAATRSIAAHEFPRSHFYSDTESTSYSLHDWATLLAIGGTCVVCLFVVVAVVRRAFCYRSTSTRLRWRAEADRLGLVPPHAAVCEPVAAEYT